MIWPGDVDPNLPDDELVVELVAAGWPGGEDDARSMVAALREAERDGVILE